MTGIIYNSLTSSTLDVTALSGPDRVTNITASLEQVSGAPPAVLEKLVSTVAQQINDQRASYTPSFRAVDLENMIADVIIETSAQGSSLLEIHLIDPYWALLRRNESGWCFIDVDPDGSGYLWPPIEINFPIDVSDATWRLCQVKPTTDPSIANLVLVFEDKIVAELREHTGAGPSPTDPSLGSSNANETRAEFIRRCVRTVSRHPLIQSDVGIRFIPLLANSDFTSADLIGSEVTLPASATVPQAPAHRQNFTKAAGISVSGATSTKSIADTWWKTKNKNPLITPQGLPTFPFQINEVSLSNGTINGRSVSELSAFPGLPQGAPVLGGNTPATALLNSPSLPSTLGVTP